MDTLVVKLSIEGQTPVKCLVVGVEGQRVELSLMPLATNMLLERGDLGPNAKAAIVFQSQVLGDSPEIGGIVRQVRLKEEGASISIAIKDWDVLATFWQDAEAKLGPW